MSNLSKATANGSPNQWLQATPYIDKEHPRVAETANRLTQGATNDLAKARATFTFVRDEIKFGFARGFWDAKASDVLASGIGYCNTKSTLFIALLRASGIPARQVFMDIHASVLHGIIDPGTPYVDHSYVEVFLNGSWIATDAYIIDSALFATAQKRTIREDRILGYGVHATGSNHWDGLSMSFSQFNALDPRIISMRDWGVYQDVGDFYQNAERPWNRLNPMMRRAFGAFASGANQRADRLRNRTI